MSHHPARKELTVFGLIWAAILLIAGFSPVLAHEPVRVLPAWAALGFLSLSLTMPSLLYPFYKVWMRIGAVLGAINSRIALTLFFFAVLTPIATLLRLIQRDPLNRKLDKQCLSYWSNRLQQPASMRYQG